MKNERLDVMEEHIDNKIESMNFWLGVLSCVAIVLLLMMFYFSYKFGYWACGHDSIVAGWPR